MNKIVDNFVIPLLQVIVVAAFVLAGLGTWLLYCN